MSIELYHWLVVASLKACVLLPLVLLAVWVSRRTASSVLGWLLLMVFVFLPILPALDLLPWGLRLTVPALEWTGAFPEEVQELSESPQVRDLATQASRPDLSDSIWELPQVIVLVWFVGALSLFLLRLGRSMLSGLCFGNARLADAQDPLYLELLGLCKKIPVKVVPWLVYHDTMQSPQTTRAMRPTIMVPKTFGATDPRQREMILLHELAHIQRGDIVTRWLVELLVALLWFHPLVWLTRRQYDLQVEIACDDAVIHAGYSSAEYGELLLASAKGQVGVASKAELRARMRSIVRANKERVSLGKASLLKFSFLFSVIILPFGLVSFTPYAPGQSYELLEDRDGLAALWRMRLGRGSVVADSSGNSHHGSIIEAEWVTDDERGVCLSFDGVKSRLVLSAPDANWTGASFTFAVWLKSAEGSDGGGLLLRGDLNDAWCSAQDSQNGEVVSLGERELFLSGAFTSQDFARSKSGLHPAINYWGIAAAYAEAALKPNKWMHLAIVWDETEHGVTIRMYLNAEPVGVNNVQKIDKGYNYDWKTDVWHFGAGESPIVSGNYYEGLVSDLAIYRKALSLDELRAVMVGDF